MTSAFLFWLKIDIFAKLIVSYTFTQLANYLLERIRNSESIEKKLINSIAWNHIQSANSGVLTAQDCCNERYLDKAKEEFRLAIGDYRNAYNYFSSNNNFKNQITAVHCDLLLGICSGFVGDWESNSFHLNRGNNLLATIIEQEKQKVNLKRDKGNRNVAKLWGANFILSGASLAAGVAASPIIISTFALSPVIFGLSFLDQALRNNTKVEKRILSNKVPGHQYSVEQLKEILDRLN